VVAHGPSLHDENMYYVIRRYASDDWRQGPREAMLVLMENYTDIVFELNEVTMQGLRKL